MWDVLFQTQRFFEALAERKPDLAAPFFIVIASTTASSLGQVLLTRLLPSGVPGGLPVQLVLALVGGVIFGILLWGLGGLLVRLLAGPDSRAWEVYGWAWVPALLVGLVLVPVGALFPVTGDLPPLPPTTDPDALRAWQREYQQLVGAAPATRLLYGLGLLGTFWSFWIIWSGLRVLAPSRALQATLGVAGVTLAIMLWSILAQP
ncbi:MAG: YIP1 family protein [Meiothermus sp.]|uniref:YIP1 family protein n=1 Tax=Meiothermus sp. TaxID=1955249 RepID=UPI0025D871D8|nr:YIP1 family protein [Meiothermus sp.]MCS7067062.1 YIP1 family protein [Meiothermus sp.]MDW8424527.1 YIP1 family protein [Meiothermus sp.]